jgi:hypothetical protein
MLIRLKWALEGSFSSAKELPMGVQHPLPEFLRWIDPFKIRGSDSMKMDENFPKLRCS